MKNKRNNKIRNNNNGFSIVNLILIVLIVLAVAFIIYEVNVPKEENEVDIENAIEEKKTDSNTTTNLKTNTSDSNNSSRNTNVNIAKLNNENVGSSSIENSNTTNYNRFFYNQLDEKAKIIYDQIISNTDKLETGTEKISFEYSEDISNYFQPAWDAFSMDNPEYFYIETENISFLTKTSKRLFGKRKYLYTIEPQEGKTYFLDSFQNQDSVKKAISDVNNLTSQLVNNATGTTSNKIKYIHDFILSNTDYDQTNATNNSNIYGTLIEKKAVCEGYAKTFKFLMDELNIPCILVYGTAQTDEETSEFHAWNYVMLDNQNWYAVDTTWDDPIVIGGGTISEAKKHEFYLLGSTNFFKTHTEDGDVSGTGQNFKYIQISESDY